MTTNFPPKSITVKSTSVNNNSNNELKLNCCSIKSQAKRNQLSVLLSYHNADIIFGCKSHPLKFFQKITKLFEKTKPSVVVEILLILKLTSILLKSQHW